MTQELFLDRYFEIQERLNAESLTEPLWWPNEDWSKLIYGSRDKKTIALIHDLTVAMEDTGNWIVKTLFQDYPDNKRTVLLEGFEDFGIWKIDYPSQLYDFLSRKKELLISDDHVRFVTESA